jgi:hypothetical protein
LAFIYRTLIVDVGVSFFATSSSSSSSSSTLSPLLLKPYQQIVARPIKALMMQATTVPIAFGVHPATRGFGPAASVPKSVACRIIECQYASATSYYHLHLPIEDRQRYLMKACSSSDIALGYMKVS